jgi:hypothetical protein
VSRPNGGGKDREMFEDEEFIDFVGRLPEEQREYISDLFRALASSNDEVTPTDLLFVGSDGSRVVKCFHYPFKALGEDGPVIMPSANENIILAAFSDEFIQTRADDIQDIFDDMDMANEAWTQFMQECAVEVVDIYDTAPPENFEVLFDQ